MPGKQVRRKKRPNHLRSRSNVGQSNLTKQWALQSLVGSSPLQKMPLQTSLEGKHTGVQIKTQRGTIRRQLVEEEGLQTARSRQEAMEWTS